MHYLKKEDEVPGGYLTRVKIEKDQQQPGSSSAAPGEVASSFGIGAAMKFNSATGYVSS